MRSWQAKNREKLRCYRIKASYGLSCEEYDKLWEQQKGLCAICATEPCCGRSALYIDHNHTTGEVRGLLCNQCNFGLGAFKDSGERMLAAIAYLDKWAEQTKEGKK